MKKILALVLSAFLLLAPSLTSAQIVFPSGQGISNPTGQTGPVQTLPPGAYNCVTRNLQSPVSCRNSKGTFLGVEAYNGTGATVYIQVFNQQLYNISLGFTAPDFEFPCSTLSFCTGQLYLPGGIAFVNGIAVAATTTEGGGTKVSTSGLEVWLQFQ